MILCGGTVNSPQLLELSGIGDGRRLQSLGIETVLDQPAVGENLQDHYVVAATWRLRPGTVSLNERSRGLRFAGEEAALCALRRRSLFTQSAAPVALPSARSRPDLAAPDIPVSHDAGDS